MPFMSVIFSPQAANPAIYCFQISNIQFHVVFCIFGLTIMKLTIMLISTNIEIARIPRPIGALAII